MVDGAVSRDSGATVWWEPSEVSRQCPSSYLAVPQATSLRVIGSVHKGVCMRGSAND